MFTIKANRSSVHISGIEVRTQSTGEEKGGVVAYYAESACGALTRNGHRMASLGSVETLAEAVKKASGVAPLVSGRKFCKTCEAAAQAALAS